MNTKFLSLVALGVAALLSGCATPSAPPAADEAAAGPSGTWAWRYRTFDVLSGEEVPAGRAELSGRPGAYSFRLAVRDPAPCAVGSVPATVASDEKNTIITAMPRMKGCGVRRFTIRKDGSGGHVETKVESKSDSWVADPYDRGLTAM